MNTKHLALSWSVSRARDTYGYNVVRLTDGRNTYRADGGGYDMTGTVFGDWLTATYQDRLLKIARRAYYVSDGNGVKAREGEHAHVRWVGTPGKPKVTPGSLYGMYSYPKEKRVSLDGGCGIESMLTIARAIGLEVERTGNRKGETTGFIVVDTKAPKG